VTFVGCVRAVRRAVIVCTCHGASYLSLNVRGDARRRVNSGEFCLGFRNPHVECCLAHDLDRNGHEGMARAAQFGALAVVDALLLRLEPGLVDASGTASIFTPNAGMARNG